MNTLEREVSQTFLISLYLLISVGTGIFDALYHRQRLYYTPSHSVTFDVLLQVADLLAGPHLTIRYIVQGCNNAFHTISFNMAKVILSFLPNHLQVLSIMFVDSVNCYLF